MSNICIETVTAEGIRRDHPRRVTVYGLVMGVAVIKIYAFGGRAMTR
jgi:hypothetical protein